MSNDTPNKPKKLKPRKPYLKEKDGGAKLDGYSETILGLDGTTLHDKVVYKSWPPNTKPRF